jgi:Tol biopolymer transport system component
MRWTALLVLTTAAALAAGAGTAPATTGTKIAFDSTRADGTEQVWTMNPDGTGLQQLTSVGPSNHRRRSPLTGRASSSTARVTGTPRSTR